ncbi:hypothetical protein FACS1894122_07600 [Alphaproteobacteria bacterium]|nr:hypothetical protein FACS1894122_07600 [Alphaproteobacteria bacterium]
MYFEKGISPEGFYQTILDVAQPLYDTKSFSDDTSQKDQINMLKVCYIYSLPLCIANARLIAKQVNLYISESIVQFAEYEDNLNKLEKYLKSFFKHGEYPEAKPLTQYELDETLDPRENVLSRS